MLGIHTHMRLSICLITICYLLISCGDQDSGESNPDFMHKSPMIIAHRGYAQYAPENTLAAFSEAARVSSDMIELDYHHTHDGEQIVIHDSFYDRTTNVRELTGEANVKVARRSSELAAKLSAGSWFDSSFTDEKVPFLGESISYINSIHGRTLIDHKDGDAASCVKTIESLGLTEVVVVQSADWEFLRELRTLSPRIAISALGRKKNQEDRFEINKRTEARFRRVEIRFPQQKINRKTS